MRAIAWLVAVTLAWPTSALARPQVAYGSAVDASAAWLMAAKKKKKKKPKPALTPAQAAEKRGPVIEEASALANAGNPAAAALVYDRGAAVQGDPVLFLEAGDEYLAAARKDTDPEMAEAASERARIALDILHFHRDPTADPGFRLVAEEEIDGLVARAAELDAAAQQAKEEIEELLAPDPPPPPPSKKKRPRTGKGKKVAGIALSTLGGVGVAVGIGGLVAGAVHQSNAEDPSVYGPDYDELARKGHNANVMAAVGLSVGGAFLVAGITLLALGRRDKKRKAAADKVVVVSPAPRGVVVTGRF